MLNHARKAARCKIVLALLVLADGAKPANTEKWREGEIRHGRVSMLKRWVSINSTRLRVHRCATISSTSRWDISWRPNNCQGVSIYLEPWVTLVLGSMLNEEHIVSRSSCRLLLLCAQRASRAKCVGEIDLSSHVLCQCLLHARRPLLFPLLLLVLTAVFIGNEVIGPTVYHFHHITSIARMYRLRHIQ